jgi:hypothetical protein
MAVDVKALTITGTIVAAVSYTICAVLVALSPRGMATLSSYILHMDIETMGRTVTLATGFIGGVLFTAIVAIFCAVSGWLYNRLARPFNESAVADRAMHPVVH